MPPSVDISRSLAPCCWPTTRPTLVLAPCFPSPRSPAHLSQLMPRHHACRTHCARARAQPPFFLLLSPPLRSARVSDSAIGATALTGPRRVRLITAPRPRHHRHCLHSVGQMAHLLYPIVSAPSPLHRCAHVVTNLAHASPTTSALYAISTCHALPTGSPGAMPLPLCKASPPCTPHAALRPRRIQHHPCLLDRINTAMPPLPRTAASSPHHATAAHENSPPPHAMSIPT